MDVLMVSGFRTTGKDEICHRIQGTGKYPWLVYSLPSTPLFFFPKESERLAFADRLKDEVSSLLGIRRE